MVDVDLVSRLGGMVMAVVLIGLINYISNVVGHGGWTSGSDLKPSCSFSIDGGGRKHRPQSGHACGMPSEA
ncbi:hypothetical protein ACHAXS_002634 [Conticribra weissflogii]